MDTSALRVLIVTCSFAPGFRPNAVMAVKLASYLSGAGADVCVLTLTQEDLLAVSPEDPGLADLLSPQIRVERVRGSIVRRLLRRYSRSRNLIEKAKRSPFLQLLVPDPYIDCIPWLIRKGLSLINRWQPSVIVSIAYPWSCHIVGSLLARSAKVNWIADYSDPWTSNPASELVTTKWRELLDTRIEKWILSSAFEVIVRTRRTKSLYLRTFPFLEGRIAVIPLGYDRSVLNSQRMDYLKRIRPVDDQRIWIVHAGRIYRSARSPEPLLLALRELIDHDRDLDSKMVVFLIGEVDSKTCGQIEQWRLGSIVKILGWMPREEIHQWLRTADLLLLFGNRGGIQVPSKLYEYLGMRKPVIVLREDIEDEASQIVQEVDAGWVVDNETHNIIQFFNSLLNDQIDRPAYKGAVSVEAFSFEAGLE